jgi:hypothetical protein
MTQAIETVKGTTPDLNTVVGQQAKLLGELSQLMASLDSADPQSLERVNNLLAAGLKGLRGEASTTDTATTTDVSVRRQAFMDKYSVTVLDDSKVSFTLPKGSSVLNLLNDAQALAPELYNRDAVYPDRLADWSTKKAFKSSVTENREFSIDGNVADSTSKSRTEQVAFLKKQNLEMPEIEHLAAAHVAYFIATGKDLFANNVVRARGGALFFSARGLCVDDYFDDYRYPYVAASAALPPRN